MRENKGFTLIELLAVIVILAIIALIATPIILGVIDDARKSAAERGAELVISEVELAYSSAYMKNNGVVPTTAQVADAFDMDGASMASNGNVTATDTNVACTTSTASGLQVTCTANGKTFTSSALTVSTAS